MNGVGYVDKNTKEAIILMFLVVQAITPEKKTGLYGE